MKGKTAFYRREVERHLALFYIAFKCGFVQKLPSGLAQLFARMHVAVSKMESEQILPLNEAVGRPILRLR